MSFTLRGFWPYMSLYKYLDLTALAQYDEKIKEFLGEVIVDNTTSTINPSSITHKFTTDKAVSDYVEQRIAAEDEVKFGYLINASGTYTFYETYDASTDTYRDPVTGKTGNLYINRLENNNLYVYTGSAYALVAEQYTASDGILKVGTNFINTGVRSVSQGTVDGSLKVNIAGTDIQLAIPGLDSAAFTPVEDYAEASHTHTISEITDIATASVAEATQATEDSAGNNIVATYATKAELQNQASKVFDIKDSVSTYSALPVSGNTEGDVRSVDDTGITYVWTGAAWTKFGTAYGAATSAQLGLVQIGSNISNADGVISVTGSNVTSALGYTPLEGILVDGVAAPVQSRKAVLELDQYTTEPEVREIIRDAVTSIYTFKGSVDFFEDLPTIGNHSGDVYNVLYKREGGQVIPSGANWAWVEVTDTSSIDYPGYWDNLSEEVDFSEYYNKDEVDQFLRAKANSAHTHTSSEITDLSSAGHAYQADRDGNANVISTTYATKSSAVSSITLAQDKLTYTTAAGVSTDVSIPTVRSIRAGNPGDLIVNTGGTETTITLSPPLTAGAGIDTTNNIITNTGVRAISTGATNGTISVNTNGTSSEVAVAGLGSAAYTASTDYATAVHTHNLADVLDLATKIALNANGITLNNGSTATTQSANDNSTKVATTAYVETAINNVLEASKAMTFEGVAGSTSDLLVEDVGATYVASAAFTLGTEVVEIGDLLIYDGHNWRVIQTNINGAVTGPVSSVNNRVATFNGTSGKIIQDSGVIINTNVADEDSSIPTGKAVKTFVENKNYETKANAIVGLSYDDATLTYTTGAGVDADVSLAHTHTASYTPAGTISAPAFTGSSSAISAEFTGTQATITTPVTAEGTVAISVGSGTANYTPAGSISQPTFTGSPGNIAADFVPSGSIKVETGNGTANYTPAGSISTPTFTGTAETLEGEYTPAGSVTIISYNTGASNYSPAGTISTPSFTGSEGNVSATYIPEGTISIASGSPGAESANYTPEGTVSQPTFTGTEATITSSYKPAGTISVGTGSANYIPAGTVSQPSFTGTAATISSSYTPSGAVKLSTLTSEDTASENDLAYTPSGTVSQPSFTGSQATLSSSYTPAGSISVGSGTANYTPAGSVTVTPEVTGASYTPAGSLSGGAISVTPSTTTVNSITDVGTLPALDLSYDDNTRTLSFNWSTGTLPTKGSATTVATGIQSATISELPAFTGTAATITPTVTATGAFAGTGTELIFTGTAGTATTIYTPTGTVSQPTFSGAAETFRAGFTGTAGTATASYTPAGTVAQPTFTGTGAELKFIGETGSATATYTPAGTVSQPAFVGTAARFTAAFTGTAGTAVGTFTPEGSVSQPTFTGTGVRLAGSFSGTTDTIGINYTPEGTISTPTFTGTGTELKATFTGTTGTATGTFTPTGTVSTPTFTGTGAELTAAFTGTQVNATTTYTPEGTISGTVIPEGSVAAPTFTGTAATITTQPMVEPSGN